MNIRKYLFLALVLLVQVDWLNAQSTAVVIETKNQALVLQPDAHGRLRTVYFDSPLKNPADYEAAGAGVRYDDDNIGITNHVYTPAGTWNLMEPAIQVRHGDGNASLELVYQKHASEKKLDGSTLTRVTLKDPKYPFQVTLCYQTWPDVDVFEQWTEIEHQEKRPVQLLKYASSNLYLTHGPAYLTSYHGRWAKEMQPREVKLERGIRTLDTKLGTRAMLLQSPNFILALGKPAEEHDGSVLVGQLAWGGNFRLDFETDAYENLRFIAGINPYASEYQLPANQVFKTPSLIYAVSHAGTGKASRDLHEWARKYRVLQGEGQRLTLLNNWEATYFDFNESKLTELFKDAKDLGVDLFLLDDGWFANKYPRNNDRAGLGDWQENVKKLPNGIGYLVKEATKAGVKFGIWIEPEMVNPKSELYEKHPEWVIKQPDRPEVYYRNQLVLDLANPEVQNFVFGIVDQLFTKNPDLAFIKWDCNAVIFNAYSPYLNKKGMPQSHLYVDYMNGLIQVLQRIRAKYPTVNMMLCSGGGGRGDYELLKYFTEFWPSDDTEPVERIYMQWDYSYFFPSIVTDNHVTDWGKQPIKYRIDVASMGKLGFDIVASHLSESDLAFCKEAIRNYHGFKDVVWHGDQYRLVDPHKNDLASLMYVAKDKRKAIMFSYLVDFRPQLMTHLNPIRLEGLDPAKHYAVKELNIYPGSRGLTDATTYTGDYLMKVGINPGIGTWRTSVILEIVGTD